MENTRTTGNAKKKIVEKQTSGKAKAFLELISLFFHPHSLRLFFLVFSFKTLKLFLCNPETSVVLQTNI